MPMISGFQHARKSIPDNDRTKKRAEKIFHLNNSIFIKAEFAKTAFRIILILIGILTYYLLIAEFIDYYNKRAD